MTTVFLLARRAAVGLRLALRPGRDARRPHRSAWDARWYWIVAERGYPSDAAAHRLRRTSPRTSGRSCPSTHTSAQAGRGAARRQWVVGAVHRLDRRRVRRVPRPVPDDARCGWTTVPRRGRSPSSPPAPLAALFQVGYAESLFLLWLFLALWCVHAPPLRVALRAHPAHGLTPGRACSRSRCSSGCSASGAGSRDAASRSAPREIVHIVALGAARRARRLLVAADRGRRRRAIPAPTSRRSSRGGATGSPGEPAFVPFEGFVAGAAFWFDVVGAGRGRRLRRPGGRRRRRRRAAAASSRTCKRLGVEMRLWSASYLVYLLLVFFPQSSIFRLLVPLSPLWGAVALPRSTVVAGRRARRRACSVSGGGSTTCTRWGIRTGRFRDARRPRDPQAMPADYPLSCARDKLDRQTTDEKEPQWQP